MDVAKAIERIAARNPKALMFGTDLPSTRAKRPFMEQDMDLEHKVLGVAITRQVFWGNAVNLYRPAVV